MRKLAPMFITTSILALAAGNVLANDMSSTDKTGSPTVSSNTQKQPLSYSDKSNTAKGTNAKMNDNASAGATTSTTVSKSDNLSPSEATDQQKYDTHREANAASDATVKHTKVKKAKAKTAHHAKAHKDTVAKDDTVTNTDTEKSMKNPPLSPTKGEAANSTTGKSAGQ